MTIGVVFVRHGTRIKLIAILFAYRRTVQKLFMHQSPAFQHDEAAWERGSSTRREWGRGTRNAGTFPVIKSIKNVNCRAAALPDEPNCVGRRRVEQTGRRAIGTDAGQHDLNKPQPPSGQSKFDNDTFVDNANRRNARDANASSKQSPDDNLARIRSAIARTQADGDAALPHNEANPAGVKLQARITNHLMIGEGL
ncbi:hypothetical protein [Sinorhizobium meliloti]|uniref:hypothetical protein n=1 Tax=Rhizobium meliloti TaxID=382 RepID=UPI001E2F8F9A|nr:hypothetical protein [Sinorhizobium meliloti]UFX13072.1 hypothetical protein SmelRRI128_33745 [Sinorhizobium meliloti]